MDFETLELACYNDLAQLPWFEAGPDGRPQLKPGAGLPPIIDMHTHFGWSYFGGRVVPYQQKFPETMQYYDYDNNPVRMERDEHPLKREADGITVDIALVLFRCPPKARTQTAANMLADMERFGIKASVVLPIEIPIRSRHAYQTVCACQPHEALIPFAGVHPWTRFKKLRLDWQTGQGCLGLKYHPEFQFAPPDAKGAIELFGMCNDRKLPVLAHSGSTGTEPGWMQKLSHPDRYRKAIESFPDLPFVLAHTAIIHYEAAIAMARQYPNVWVETSGQGVPVLRRIFREVDQDRILFGTDWSFFPHGVPLARSLAALDGLGDELRDKYFYKNAVRFLGLDEAQFRAGRVVRVSDKKDKE